MTITKPSKAKLKPKDQHIIDAKPVQLAKIMYAAIARYVKARNARIGDKNANFTLDSSRARSYVVDNDNLTIRR